MSRHYHGGDDGSSSMQQISTQHHKSHMSGHPSNHGNDYHFPSTDWNRQFSRLPDGSIRPTGYFNGLDRIQASRSMDLLKREYQSFVAHLPAENSKPGDARQAMVHITSTRSTQVSGRNGSSQSRTGQRVPQASLDSDIGAAQTNTNDHDQVRENCPDLQHVHKLLAVWGSRCWSTRFEIYYQYDGPINLSISWWDRLLYWIWCSLTEKHMGTMHNILYRLRTNTNTIANIHYEKSSGRVRSKLQEQVIRDYHRVYRSGTNQDIGSVIQRFHLADLFHSHNAYVQHFHDTKRLPWQTARHEVNLILVKAFTEELHMSVSIQTIQNQVKEGRHWDELLRCPETRSMGSGLLLLLPIHPFADVVRKTADPIWTFLLSKLSNICPKMLELARALTPIAEAIKTEGIGFITHPMLGYELITPANIHDLTHAEFQKCLALHENLSTQDALRAIRSHGREKEPTKVEELVLEDQERKNRREGRALLQRARDIVKSAEHEIETLEREGNRKLQQTVVNLSTGSSNVVKVINTSESASPTSMRIQPEGMDGSNGSEHGSTVGRACHSMPETSHVSGFTRKRYHSPEGQSRTPYSRKKATRPISDSQTGAYYESNGQSGIDSTSTSDVETESSDETSSNSASSSDVESDISKLQDDSSEANCSQQEAESTDSDSDTAGTNPPPADQMEEEGLSTTEIASTQSLDTDSSDESQPSNQNPPSGSTRPGLEPACTKEQMVSGNPPIVDQYRYQESSAKAGSTSSVQVTSSQAQVQQTPNPASLCLPSHVSHNCSPEGVRETPPLLPSPSSITCDDDVVALVAVPAETAMKS